MWRTAAAPHPCGRPRRTKLLRVEGASGHNRLLVGCRADCLPGRGPYREEPEPVAVAVHDQLQPHTEVPPRVAHPHLADRDAEQRLARRTRRRCEAQHPVRQSQLTELGPTPKSRTCPAGTPGSPMRGSYLFISGPRESSGVAALPPSGPDPPPPLSTEVTGHADFWRPAGPLVVALG
jgi:hypothetical protein